MQKFTPKAHYDLLIQENNDPANDPPVLKNYMDKWDGPLFIDALALNPDSNVLEIGVGTGRLAKRVLDAGCARFTGIDISPATIKRARENLSNWSNVSLLEGDFMDHQFPQTFDTIYCSLTLFHFKDKKAFIQKAAALLSTKGRFVVSIPKEKETVIEYGTREVDIYPDDLNELISLIREAGLVLMSVIEVEFANILNSMKI